MVEHPRLRTERCLGPAVAKKRKDNIEQIRTGVYVAVAILVLGVVGYGLYYSIGFGMSGGEPYVALDKPDATGAVEVVEYFSYECPHCRSLETLLDDWQSDLPEGVVFTRVHVAYSATNRMFAKAHRALQRQNAIESNHQRLFRAIHDRNKRFLTARALAEFVDGYGVDRESFLQAMASPRTVREVDAGERRFISLGLVSVPALVVDDKYIVNMDAGRRQALAVTDDLVRKLVADRARA